MKNYIIKNFLPIFNIIFIILGITSIIYGKNNLLTLAWIIAFSIFFGVIIIDFFKWKKLF
jgi:hypothetical protein